jgi:hypothetical protein
LILKGDIVKMDFRILWSMFEEPPRLFLILILAIILLLVTKSIELTVVSLERLGLIDHFRKKKIPHSRGLTPDN